MSSIHKILFSPQSSPRSSPKLNYSPTVPSAQDTSTATTSSSSFRSKAAARIANLDLANCDTLPSGLGLGLASPAELDSGASGLKARSPRSPRVSQFEQVQMPAPMSMPTMATGSTTRSSARNRGVQQQSHNSASDSRTVPSSPGQTGNPYYNGSAAASAEVEKTPRTRDGRRILKAPKSPYLPSNMPSSPLPKSTLPASISARIIRLALVLSAMGVVAFVLSRATGAGSSMLSRTTPGSDLNGDGVMRRGDRGPPQVETEAMMRRARATRATRPTLVNRPIPSTHELLALQSYLLQSKHNALPSSLDPSKPLDANAMLSVSPGKLGLPGSRAERAWLKDLEREHEDDLIIWHGAGEGYSKIVSFLDKVILDGRAPSLIDTKNRADRLLLKKLMTRLGYDIEKNALVMLGKTVVKGGLEELEKMKGDGRLEVELSRVGWWDKWKAEHPDEDDDEPEAEKPKAAEKPVKEEKAKEETKAEKGDKKQAPRVDADKKKKDAAGQPAKAIARQPKETIEDEEDDVDEEEDIEDEDEVVRVGKGKRVVAARARKAEAKKEKEKQGETEKRPRIMNAAFKKKA